MWGDGINPTLDIMFRTNDGQDAWNTNQWTTKSSYPVTAATLGNAEFAVHHSSRMVVLQKYTIANLADVDKLTLTLVGTSGTDAMSIWLYNTNDWSSTTASELATAVKTVTGQTLGDTSSDTHTTTYLLKNEQSTKTTTEGIITCTFEISGTALNTLKTAATDNTFTLLITSKIGEIASSGSDRKFFGSYHSTTSYRPNVNGINPSLEMMFRTNNDNGDWNTNQWTTKSSYPITATTLGDAEMAAKHAACEFVLQKYTVEDLTWAKSITLNLTGSSGTDALAIWVFNSNDWTVESGASSLASAVETVTGFSLKSGNGTKNSDKLLKDEGIKGTKDGDNTPCTFELDLSKLKQAISGNTFTLLITNRTSEITGGIERKFFGSAHSKAAYRPFLTISYYSASVEKGGETTYYETLAAAQEALPTDADATITVFGNQNFSTCFNAIPSHTLNIVAGKDDVTITNTASNTLSFNADATYAGTINIGSAEHPLIIKNSATTSNNIVGLSGTNAAAIINITNVTFKDITSSNASGIINANGTGSVGALTMNNVTFSNCSVTASNAGIIYNQTNDKTIVSGSLTFTDCTGNNFKLNGRIDENSFSPEQVYTIYNNGINLGQSAVIKMNAANRGNYKLVNSNQCIAPKMNSTNEEMVISEAYTLTVSAAECATLILPYATTIPDDVTCCYTVAHISGSSTVTATPVETTTLEANTPVLVNASAGTHKFNRSERKPSSEGNTEKTGTGTHTTDALTGVYSDSEITFTTENIESTYANTYILNKINENVGFYKAANGLKVGANRAYLTATNVPDTGEARSLSIVFDDGETTGVTDVRSKMEEVKDDYFDLSGRRVAHPTKGLYIMNGKKIIIK